jgi:hypothetical protein
MCNEVRGSLGGDVSAGLQVADAMWTYRYVPLIARNILSTYLGLKDE